MTENARFLWFGISLCSVLLTAPVLAEEDREQLITKARDGNRAAILSITTLECRYERLPWADTTLEQAKGAFHLFSPGMFWQSGDVYRLFHPVSDGTTVDYVVRNGRFHTLHKDGPMPRPILALGTPKPVDGVGSEMWQWLLFSHWAWVPASFYPFYEILEHPHDIRAAERLPPPDNTIHIELTHGGGRLEFWFDPKVNYLIRKSVMVPAGDTTYRWEHEVVQFLEGAPAVFVPIVIEHRCFIKGKLRAALRTVLSDVKVNQPLAKDALRLPGIAGMECVDMDREVKYRVDADANPIGPEIPTPVYKGATSNHPGGPPPTLAIQHPIPHLSEPSTPGWVWILIGSAIILVTALTLTIVRRRRQAARL